MLYEFDESTLISLDDIAMRIDEAVEAGVIDRSLLLTMLHTSARLLAAAACDEREFDRETNETQRWEAEGAIIRMALATEIASYQMNLDIEDSGQVPPAMLIH